jgi:hypothetical protein
LEGYFENVLRGLSNNLLDLLYNSNEPSNIIKPGGLGGTPIKKNHYKKESYGFTPWKFPICGPYVIIWCGWHLVSTVSIIGIDLADELVLI